MSLTGKGFMIWKVRDCEGGNPALIVSEAKKAGLTHVLIKIADGSSPYNIVNNIDQAAPVVSALKANGIQAWGWHYVYGDNPVGEARIAVNRVLQLGLDGYVIDAETEYKLPNREDNARLFMNELRRSLPNKPIALSSFRFPTLHYEFPWKAFLDKCDYNMPQVYWQGAHNPEVQLRRSVREFQALDPVRPVLPTGPVYRYGDWQPTPEDMVEFLNAAQTLKLPSVNFFTWDYRLLLNDLWHTIAAYPWVNGQPLPDLPYQYIESLNSHDPALVASLYRSDAVHITAAHTVQGTSALLNWYTAFLGTSLPGAQFQITSSQGVGNSRHFTWSANSSVGRVNNGSDTIGILNGKIVYHYSYFTIS